MKLKKSIIILGMTLLSAPIYTSCDLDLAPIDYYGAKTTGIRYRRLKPL